MTTAVTRPAIPDAITAAGVVAIGRRVPLHAALTSSRRSPTAASGRSS